MITSTAPALTGQRSRLLLRAFVMVLLAALVLVGCSDGEGPSEPEAPAPEVAGIQVSPGSAGLVALGATTSFSAVVRDQNGNAMTGKPVSWSSSQAEVFTVSADGEVTATGVGTATLSATSGSFVDTAQITVTQDVVVLELTPVTHELEEGESIQLEFMAEDGNGHPVNDALVVWTSSSPEVVAVDAQTGLATAESAGTATIAGTSGEGSDSLQVTVTAPPPPPPVPVAQVTVSPGEVELAPGETATLEARVEDADGAELTDRAVAWTSSDAGVATVSQGGTVTAQGEGTAVITAASEGESGTAEVTVTAPTPPPATNIEIDDISPEVLVEGEEATISGSGLDEADVSIDGVAAEILSGSSTQITVRVPVRGCRPTGPAVVDVSDSESSADRTVLLEPGGFIPQVAFGEMWMSSGTPEEGHCLHVPESEDEVTYLIGVQSLAPSAGSLTPATLQIRSAQTMGAQVADVMMERAAASRMTTGVELPQGVEVRQLDAEPAPVTALERLAGEGRDGVLPQGNDPDHDAHAHAHFDRISEGLELMERFGPQIRREMGARTAMDGGVPDVGDSRTVRVPASCSASTTITGTVRAVGQTSIWIEDDNRPSGGLEAGDYDDLASLYDVLIEPELTRYLGEPTDLDGNDRVIIVVTPEVNDLETVNGFMFTGDMLTESQCGSSNEGEYFYVVAPDPGGETGRTLTVGQVLDMYPGLLAHEMTHVIHMGQQLHLAGNTMFPEIWEAEGLATFMEQIVGHAATGHGSGQNLGGNEVAADLDWYGAMFFDLASYVGFQSSSARNPDAPHECSWLSGPPNGPCTGASRMPYGPPASLYRWIADQAWSPATEDQMTRNIVSASEQGFPLLEELASEDLQWIMAFWASALVNDGRYFGSGIATFTSWDMHDVFGLFTQTARPTPMEASYDFESSVAVRGGSVAWFLVTGSHAEIGIGAGDLPADMRLWLIRVE